MRDVTIKAVPLNRGTALVRKPYHYGTSSFEAREKIRIAYETALKEGTCPTKRTTTR